jgi:hypothetical protein
MIVEGFHFTFTDGFMTRTRHHCVAPALRSRAMIGPRRHARARHVPAWASSARRVNAMRFRQNPGRSPRQRRPFSGDVCSSGGHSSETWCVACLKTWDFFFSYALGGNDVCIEHADETGFAISETSKHVRARACVPQRVSRSGFPPRCSLCWMLDDTHSGVMLYMAATLRAGSKRHSVSKAHSPPVSAKIEPTQAQCPSRAGDVAGTRMERPRS